LSGPVIDDGCVVVQDDRIVLAGAYRDFRPASVDHDIDGVLMPGLINFHTHLELTNIPRPASPGSFVDWILTISPLIRGDKATFVQRRADAVRQGVAQCVKFGVTRVWDITQNVQIVRPVLEESGIRYISFGECLGIGERRPRFDSLLVDAISTEHSPAASIGVSPHAPYTVDGEGLQNVIEQAEAAGLPVMLHLSETPDEAAFLLDHSGPLGEIYRRLNIDPGPAPGFSGGPIAWLNALGAKSIHAAHVNYCSDADILMLKQMNATVVWCPRTHDYFGHPPHRWKEMCKAGVAVRFGTDSCASSPDLNLVDDLRLVHQQSPDVDPMDLFRRAAGMIRPGELADMVAFPTDSKDPLRQILQTPDVLPTHVWVGGKLIKP
jgi:cytosine/adenosine deaminase-related metal-dependent hydrolase